MYDMIVYSDASNWSGKEQIVEQYQETLKKFKSAVEFYKRYRNLDYSSEGYELLKKEKPEIYKEFIDYLKNCKICACIYNSWLFDYAFQDVI